MAFSKSMGGTLVVIRAVMGALGVGLDHCTASLSAVTWTMPLEQWVLWACEINLCYLDQVGAGHVEALSGDIMQQDSPIMIWPILSKSPGVLIPPSTFIECIAAVGQRNSMPIS